jgi:peptidoglycan/xylan/chitin deacetylase (PgdA/CDA1 family)
VTDSVPVLIYHHVNRHRGDTVTITPPVFADQMAYLAEHRIRTLSMEELLAFAAGRLTLRERAVLLTFDDGWRDNYLHVWPVLRRYGLRGTFFLVTDRTERAGEGSTVPAGDWPTHDEAKLLLQDEDGGGVAMGWREAREMADSGLCSFYSHTRSHRRCAGLEESELAEELAGSRQVLEERLGTVCDVLCWPYGSFDSAAVTAATAAGYRTIFTTIPGRVVPGSDCFRLPRIEATESLDAFIRELEK